MVLEPPCDRRRIEDQNYTPVSELGRPADTGNAGHRIVHRSDDDLGLAEYPIDGDCNRVTAFADDEGVEHVAKTRIEIEQRAKPYDGNR